MTHKTNINGEQVQKKTENLGKSAPVKQSASSTKIPFYYLVTPIIQMKFFSIFSFIILTKIALFTYLSFQYQQENIRWRCLTHDMGSLYGHDLFWLQDYKRILISIFLQYDQKQLVLDCLGLAYLSYKGQKYIGNFKLLLVFIATTLLGNLKLLLVDPNVFVMGSSYGVIGVFAFRFCCFLFNEFQGLNGYKKQKGLIRYFLLGGLVTYLILNSSSISKVGIFECISLGYTLGLLNCSSKFVSGRQKKLFKLLLVVSVLLFVKSVQDFEVKKGASEREALRPYEELTQLTTTKLDYREGLKSYVPYCDKEYYQLTKKKFSSQKKNKKSTKQNKKSK